MTQVLQYAERYTPPRFYSVPASLIEDADISKNQIRIYCILLNCSDHDSVSYISNKSVAEQIGITHEGRNVRKMAKKLQDKGYIQRLKSKTTDKNGVTHIDWAWRILK